VQKGESPLRVGWSGLSGVRQGVVAAVQIICRRSPNLPHTFACSTIGPTRLNFRVRDGNGWDPRGMVTGKVKGVWDPSRRALRIAGSDARKTRPGTEILRAERSGFRLRAQTLAKRLNLSDARGMFSPRRPSGQLYQGRVRLAWRHNLRNEIERAGTRRWC
jgi:hypothetical protein